MKIVSDTVRSWSACWLLCLSPSGALWCGFSHVRTVCFRSLDESDGVSES